MLKQFRSEHANNYDQYAFGYTTYSSRSKGELRSKVLSEGFLPYTGHPPIKSNLYYLARGIRVKSAPLKLSSENRRVIRKFDTYTIHWDFQIKEKYDWTNSDMQFCRAYATERFSKSFNQQRIERILSHDHCTHICHIKREGKTVGILIVSCDDDAWHYWFAFFSLTEFTSLPLGKWAMTSFIVKAHENNIPFVYLGTCYGKGALYKVRDFNDISYFDGNQWVDDKARLKTLCKNEEETNAMDLIKKHPLYYENILNQP